MAKAAATIRRISLPGRHACALALAFVLVCGASPVLAADAARILVVLSGDQAPYRDAAAAAQQGLTQLGHEVRSVQLADLAKDPNSARGDGYDAVLAVGTHAAVALAKTVEPATKLVYCMVAHPDAVALGADSPVSGISTDIPLDAQVKLMAEAMPKLRTVGMLYRSDVPKSVALMETVRAGLPENWRLEAVAVDKHASAAEAINTLLDKKVDIVWTAPDASVYNAAIIRSLLLSALRRQTPVFGFSPAFVRAGALLGTGVDAETQGQQAADLTNQLLGDRQAASKPGTPAAVRQGPKFHIAVNLIVAEKLGLEIPEALVRKAAKVIKPEEDGT